MTKILYFDIVSIEIIVYFLTMTLKNTLKNVLTVGSILGLFFSFLITIEKLELLKNANYIPSCNLSPLISCGSVMKTPQASIFGFPNTLLGILGFAVMLTVGMAMQAGASFRRWFWLGAQAGMTLALVFVYWLFFQSVYRIGALCPYCIGVWIVTIPMFWYLTLYNVEEKNIKISSNQENIVDILKKYHLAILFAFYLVIILAILTHFWTYWSTLV